MKKFIALTAAAGLLATALYAGGPVVLVEDDVVVAEAAPTSGKWLVPALLLAFIGLAVIASEDDSSSGNW